MSFHVARNEHATTVFLSGEIDLERSPDARAELLKAVDHGLPVVVDMADVRYIDSSGIASLVEAFQRARDAGVDFSLARVSAPALKVLQLARLDRVFSLR